MLVNAPNSINTPSGLGIGAGTATGDITITSGSISSRFQGIDARITGGSGGGIMITANGAITSSTDVGINTVVTGSGNTAITLNGNVSGLNGVVATAGSGNIAVTNAATVSGSSIGVQLIGGTTKTLDNFGTITGATGISMTTGSSSVFNVGTITGTGGTAVQFAGGGNTLTLAPTSVINGSVLGLGADTFQLGGSGTGSFDASLIGPAQQYRGFNTFNKISDSSWTLTGTNALALPWTVQQGILNVAGSLPNSPFTLQNGTLFVSGTIGAATVNSGSFSVLSGGLAGPVTMTNGTSSIDGTVGPLTMSGGLLNGIGTLGGLTVNGGIVAPGHSIGTLNVNGPVSFAAGSVYQVEANAAGQSDKILATGAATLTGGTVQALPAPGAYGPSTVYTILTANGGRTGAFANATSSLPFLIPSLSYDANNVFLTLARNATFLQSQGGTGNQAAVGGALDTFPTSNPLFLNLVALNGTPALRQALDALSGEVHADLQNSLIDDSRYVRQGVLGRLRQAPFEGTTGPMAALGFAGPALAYQSDASEALAYTDPKSPRSPIHVKAPIAPPVAPALTTFWATGYGAWGHTDGDGNAATLKRDIGGFLVGADRKLGDNWWAGLAAGYSHSRIRVADRASSADVDTGHIAGYTGASFGAINLRGGAAYALHDIDTSRSIIFPGFSDTARVSYHGGTAQAFGEIGYGLATGPIAWEPFGGLAWVHLNTSSFAEVGGPAALNGSGTDRDIGYSTLGLRAATVYALDKGMTLAPRVTAAWQHAFGNVTPGIGLTFQSVIAPFAITGVPLARDGALVEAGADLRINPRTTLGIYYNGYLATRTQDHAVRGKFSVAF